MFTVCPLVMLVLTGMLLPVSESSAGGNFNLRYLSPPARRDLTPFPSVQQDHNLRPDLAYTLYVPGAGFLWSDSMMWKQSVPQTLSKSSACDTGDAAESWSVEGSHRAFFQDKFRERYPWQIQPISDSTQEWRRPRVVRSGTTVRLYDTTAAQYLCVIHGQRVTSEAGYLGEGNSTEQAPDRIRVG